jgi:hypothetical protein
MANALDVNIVHNSNPKLLLINDSRSVSGIVIHMEGTFVGKFQVSEYISFIENVVICSTEQCGDSPQYSCTRIQLSGRIHVAFSIRFYVSASYHISFLIIMHGQMLWL